jgi:hypothetical protein
VWLIRSVAPPNAAIDHKPRHATVRKIALRCDKQLILLVIADFPSTVR